MLFDDQRKASDRLAKIHGLAAQIYRACVGAGTHHASRSKAWLKAASHVGDGGDDISSDSPGILTIQPQGVLPMTVTALKRAGFATTSSANMPLALSIPLAL